MRQTMFCLIGECSEDHEGSLRVVFDGEYDE